MHINPESCVILCPPQKKTNNKQTKKPHTQRKPQKKTPPKIPQKKNKIKESVNIIKKIIIYQNLSKNSICKQNGHK